MKNKKLLIFFLITIAVIVAAGITARIRAPQSSIERELLFPGLADQINNVSKVTIQGNRNTVELLEQDKKWVVKNLDNYPANFNKVRATVINLSQFKIVDEKTDNPELYSRLSVEDPATEHSTSSLITLFNNSDQELISVIIGQQRLSSSSKPGLYIRKPDRKQALLVEGVLDISTTDVDWISRELFHIPSVQVKNVKIQYHDGNMFEINKATKEQPDFDIRGNSGDIPSASKIIINRIATGLEDMRADGVKAVNNFTFPEDSITTTVTTFNGMVVAVKLAQQSGHTYAHFNFSPAAEAPDEIKVRREAAGGGADAVNTEELIQQLSTLSNWVYQIPDFKYEALTSDPESIKNLMQSIRPDKNTDNHN
jgi:hypothetical protein